eukprot:468914-Hanusia_phi.AAC.3
MRLSLYHVREEAGKGRSSPAKVAWEFCCLFASSEHALATLPLLLRPSLAFNLLDFPQFLLLERNIDIKTTTA